MSDVVYVGIDPAATTGLVALRVPDVASGDPAGWRWVTSDVISKSARAGLTKMENKLALYDRARDFITTVGARYAILERPSDNVPRGWKGKGQNTQGAQSADVEFTIGESVGILAAAAHSTGCRVFTYPATSSRGTKKKKPRVGWMPMAKTGALVHVQARARTLIQLQMFADELRDHTRGIVRTPGHLASPTVLELDENVLMALGVLRFHLSHNPTT